MSRNLKELEKEILRKKHSPDEWLALEKELDEIWENVSEDEREEFVDSGAGDMLGQMIEFMD